ncbi:hypothetical protein [Actinomadura chibensis]|uniref:Alpha/beta hydrolase n=1 Tax=Actinomadura chibensis TaxID=392828 RepID=A0A5D0NV51_9ACTN|nr:hypothetical protein [Actinomadura chibensis]TYB48533.1 hypothetical protein FXF69_04925 [Actinomadura chibensis]
MTTAAAVVCESFRLAEHVACTVTRAVDRSPVGCFYYLPGRWQRAVPWTTEPGRDIRTELALAGVTTVCLEYRCADLQDDQGALTKVSTKDLLDDLSVCTRWSAETLGLPALGIGGFSLGAALAALAVRTRSSAYPDALVLLDGGLEAGATAAGDPPTSAVLRNPVPALPGGPDGGAAGTGRFRRLFLSTPEDDLQLDYLRAMYTFWPGRQVHELQAIANSGSFEGTRLHKPGIRRLFAVHTASRARRVLSSVRNLAGAETERTVVELPVTWRHGDVLSHRDAAQRVFRPLADWLTEDHRKASR